MNGPDPRLNQALASAIAAAKKQSFPKASIEAAIARGQGKSVSGLALVPLTVEIMLPPAVGVIIECQTENKNRTIHDLKYLIRDFGGSVSPVSHLFDRRGRIVMNNLGDKTEEDLLDAAVEAGALDFEKDSDGNVEFLTDTQATAAATTNLKAAFGGDVLSSGLTWIPKKDTLATVEDTVQLENLLSKSKATACSTCTI